MPSCKRPSSAGTSWAAAKRPSWPTATATVAIASGRTRATCAACRRRRTRFGKAADDYRRALELYQGIVPYNSANVNIVRVQGSLSALEYRLAQLEAGQSR